MIDRCMIAKIYLNDAGIQRKLLQENDPFTLVRALTIAKEAETADKNLKEMKAPTQELDFTSSNPASMKVKSEPVQKIHPKESSVLVKVLKVVLRVTTVATQAT